MNVETRDTLDEYYAHAGSWADERTQSIYASRKIAWIIALVATVVALLLAIALIILLPLKTVVPHTILVDRQTGFVQAVDPANPQKLAPQKALTQSFLVQYVQAREGFDIATVQGQFRKVSLWTSGPAKSRYVNLMQAANPQSPLVIYPRNSVVHVRVRSVSQISDNTALVRFASIRRDQGAAEQPEENWVAIIKFRYSSAPMTVEDRYINPLGFEVTDYRKDPESLVAESSSPSANAVTPAQSNDGAPRVPLSGDVSARQQ
jgi:type IV secretion system protein VirB8